MPTYVAWGRRDYHAQPVPPYARRGVEFQAVLRGPLVPWEPWDDRPGDAAARTLWVYGPGVVHGWRGVRARPCEVLVVHEPTPPEALAAALGKARVLRVKLDASAVAGLARLARLLTEPVARSGPRRRLLEQLALHELSLLALPNDGPAGEPHDPPQRHAAEIAQRALGWYAEHLTVGPSVEDAAAAVYVSAVHLRRLFARAGLDAPLTEFQRLRMDRADALLRSGDAKLAAIAAQLGFAGPESFQRAYRQARGRSPGRNRRR